MKSSVSSYSSRKIEQATYECLPFRFMAGDLPPDHDTIATFRKTFLPELQGLFTQGLFTQVLLIAHVAGVLKLGRISLDGTKLHADASKSQAVSYRRLLEVEVPLSQEVSEWLALAERTDQGEPQPEGLVIEDEIHRRQDRLANLAEAKAVLEARAEARYRLEQTAFEEKVRQREEKARARGGKPRGRAPVPPTPGARDKDQYNLVVF